jgi:hypothetical protein
MRDQPVSLSETKNLASDVRVETNLRGPSLTLPMTCFCNSLKIRYQFRWGERAIISYIAARLEASRSGDFQSPFVKSGRFQIALPWFTSSPRQK